MSIVPLECRSWAIKQTRNETAIESTAVMGMNLGRSERQPGAYIIWRSSELRVVSTSDTLFDEPLFPWRPKEDQRPPDPPPLPSDGDVAQPPTLPPGDEQWTNPAKIESNLAAEFVPAPHTKVPPLRLTLAPHASRTVCSSSSLALMRGLTGLWPSCSGWASRLCPSTTTLMEV